MSISLRLLCNSVLVSFTVILFAHKPADVRKTMTNKLTVHMQSAIFTIRNGTIHYILCVKETYMLSDNLLELYTLIHMLFTYNIYRIIRGLFIGRYVCKNTCKDSNCLSVHTIALL